MSHKMRPKQRLRQRIEAHLGQGFLRDRIGDRLHPQDVSGKAGLAARAQHHAGRQVGGKALRTELVETHMDPDAARIDQFDDRLSGDHGGAGIGIACSDQAINRSEQLQVGALGNQRRAIGLRAFQLLAGAITGGFCWPMLDIFLGVGAFNAVIGGLLGVSLALPVMRMARPELMLFLHPAPK